MDDPKVGERYWIHVRLTTWAKQHMAWFEGFGNWTICCVRVGIEDEFVDEIHTSLLSVNDPCKSCLKRYDARPGCNY